MQELLHRQPGYMFQHLLLVLKSSKPMDKTRASLCGVIQSIYKKLKATSSKVNKIHIKGFQFTLGLKVLKKWTNWNTTKRFTVND